MSQQHRPHRDPVSEHVADSFLQEDLRHVLAELLRPAERDFVGLLIEELGNDSSPERDKRLLRRILARVRLHPVHEARLRTYLGDQAVDEPGICPVCLGELRHREEGKGGRPRKYCGPECKRKAHHIRTRSRQHR